MAKKQVIRLTESDLHRIIKESVNKILSEGKTVNNKPFFRGHKDLVKPGRYVDDRPYDFRIDNFDKGSDMRDRYWQFKGYEDTMDALNSKIKEATAMYGDTYKWYEIHEIVAYEIEAEFLDALRKHNERTEKYNPPKNSNPFKDDAVFIPKFGEKKSE